MERVISKVSIRQANDNVRTGSLNNVNIDSKNVSVNIRTSFGCKEITIPKQRIIDAARSVYRSSRVK